MHQKVILTVDDEVHILELLQYNLQNAGFRVLQAESGEEALRIVAEQKVDAIILDLMLPGMDGLEALQRIRSMPALKKVPILMLTAKSEEIDTVLGLEMGADDYLGKPFSVRELLARVKAVFRRLEEVPQQASIDPIKTVDNKMIIEDLEINEMTRTVYKSGQNIEMPLKEFELLRLLAKNRGRVFSREDLLEKIWGYDYLGETRTIDVHIRHLRKKIEVDDSQPHFIKTVRGIGYKFREDHK